MNRLSKEQVLHVANLAKLNVTEQQIDIYSKQLSDILTEIDKIIKVDITNANEIMISSTNNINTYSEDTIGTMLTKEEVLKNASSNTGDFISVPRVIND